MMSDIRVKICGLTDRVSLDAAVAAGAAYVGFVFFPKSPRYLTPESAAELAATVPPGVCKVALTVNMDMAELGRIVESVPLDMLQLHGAESPEQVLAVKAETGLPVMKAVGVASEEDLPALERYGSVADQLLVDAKPPKGSVLPGGNGVAFDWRLFVGRRWPAPGMLAGGLSPENVAEAIKLTGARQVDVSSGVESEPGVKDTGKIAAFVEAAKA